MHIKETLHWQDKERQGKHTQRLEQGKTHKTLTRRVFHHAYYQMSQFLPFVAVIMTCTVPTKKSRNRVGNKENRKLRSIISLVTGLACHGLANFTLAAMIMHFRPASQNSRNEEDKMAVKGPTKFTGEAKKRLFAIK